MKKKYIDVVNISDSSSEGESLSSSDTSSDGSNWMTTKDEEFLDENIPSKFVYQVEEDEDDDEEEKDQYQSSSSYGKKKKKMVYNDEKEQEEWEAWKIMTEERKKKEMEEKKKEEEKKISKATQTSSTSTPQTTSTTTTTSTPRTTSTTTTTPRTTSTTTTTPRTTTTSTTTTSSSSSLNFAEREAKKKAKRDKKDVLKEVLEEEYKKKMAELYRSDSDNDDVDDEEMIKRLKMSSPIERKQSSESSLTPSKPSENIYRQSTNFVTEIALFVGAVRNDSFEMIMYLPQSKKLQIFPPTTLGQSFEKGMFYAIQINKDVLGASQRIKPVDFQIPDRSIQDIQSAKKEINMLGLIRHTGNQRQMTSKTSNVTYYLREYAVAFRTKEMTVEVRTVQIWNKQSEATGEPGTVMAILNAKTDSYLNVTRFSVGEGSLLMLDVKTSQAKEFKEWMAKQNEEATKPFKLPPGVVAWN